MEVSGIAIDDEAREVYISDGYMNKRVIVFDSETGAFKRLWGAYGNPPNDADPGVYNPTAPTDQQFRNPVHCVHISSDGQVYVCDRTTIEFRFSPGKASSSRNFSCARRHWDRVRSGILRSRVTRNRNS